MLKNNKRLFAKSLKCLIAVIIAAIVFPLLFISCANAKSDSAEQLPDKYEIIDEQAKSNEINKIEEQLEKYSSFGAEQIIPGYDPKKVITDTAKGKFNFNIAEMFNKLLGILFKEIYQNIHILVKLLVIVIMCSILRNLQASFLSESVGELAFYSCYVVMVGILILSFKTALEVGTSIIDNMVSFMHATLPILVTLLASSGNITSAGIFQPMLIMIVEVTATFIKGVFIPLIFLSVVLTIVDNISDKIQISKLSGLLKQISGWLLGGILTVFIAIVTIQGSLGAIVDGVTGKTAKFAINTFIPVAGKYLADAADTVIGCTLLIKNAAGVGVMVGIIGICLIPLLKILAIVMLYRLTCVIIEPIAEKRITKCINDMAGSLTFVLGIAASVTFMFLITVTAIIGASNVSAMIR